MYAKSDWLVAMYVSLKDKPSKIMIVNQDNIVSFLSFFLLCSYCISDEPWLNIFLHIETQ